MHRQLEKGKFARAIEEEKLNSSTDHDICDYENSSYRTDFWENQGRDYEDLVERIAIRRLMPSSGNRMLELGAGFGRLTDMFSGYSLRVILDYSISQLEFARSRFGDDGYMYVAADIYKLPFAPGVFDGATMIRVIHHLRDPLTALKNVRYVMQKDGNFLLEYANKQNIKAIARYLLGKQEWNPFKTEPIEFVNLNINFHPDFIDKVLEDSGFSTGRKLTVSHFRIALLKKLFPPKLLASLDAAAQLTGSLWQLSPSVFVINKAFGYDISAPSDAFWRCYHCGSFNLNEEGDRIFCEHCGKSWNIINGIYNFKNYA